MKPGANASGIPRPFPLQVKFMILGVGKHLWRVSTPNSQVILFLHAGSKHGGINMGGSADRQYPDCLLPEENQAPQSSISISPIAFSTTRFPPSGGGLFHRRGCGGRVVFFYLRGPMTCPDHSFRFFSHSRAGFIPPFRPPAPAEKTFHQPAFSEASVTIT